MQMLTYITEQSLTPKVVHYFASFVLFLLFSGLAGLSYFAFRIFARNNLPGIYYDKNTVGINKID